MSKIISRIQAFLLFCQATVILKLSYTVVLHSHKFHYEFHNNARFNSQEIIRSVSLKTISLQRMAGKKEGKKEGRRMEGPKDWKERERTRINSTVSMPPLAVN